MPGRSIESICLPSISLAESRCLQDLRSNVVNEGRRSNWSVSDFGVIPQPTVCLALVTLLKENGRCMYRTRLVRRTWIRIQQREFLNVGLFNLRTTKVKQQLLYHWYSIDTITRSERRGARNGVERGKTYGVRSDGTTNGWSGSVIAVYIKRRNADAATSSVLLHDVVWHLSSRIGYNLETFVREQPATANLAFACRHFNG